MKLVLLQDVKNIGKKGTLVEVADGYARNYLLPRKLATAATEGVVRSLDKQAADLSAKKLREKEAAQELGRKLSETAIQLRVKVGDKGKLFGSVTSQDIAEAVHRQMGHKLDKKNITLKDPLKTLGEHSVPVKLHPEVVVQLKLSLAAGE
jgi:large subunit ribosomal protein L9